jgi:hypothetical protein
MCFGGGSVNRPILRKLTAKSLIYLHEKTCKMNMNVLVLQKRMSLSNVKLPNIDQIDCQFIGVFLLTDEKKYT